VRILNAKDIESLENTSLAGSLLLGPSAELPVDCGGTTWFECEVTSCIQNSQCAAESNCTDNSCDEETCLAASCVRDSVCAEESGCDDESGCNNLSLCDGASVAEPTADIDLARLLRQAVLE
jgi:hypothetical protein